MSALSLRNGSAAGEWAWPGAPSILLPLVTVWALIIPNWAEFMLDQPRSTRGLVVGVAAALALIALARPGGTRRGRAQGAPEAHPTGPDGG
jgi:hypothetical protein